MEARRAAGSEGLGMGEVGCADIDECEDDSFNDCDAEADCINTPGTYTCECREGFYGTGFFVDALNPGCYNINECKTGRVDCDPNASCVDIEGSGLYHCECNSGYHGPGDKCFDDDECKLGTHNCDPMKSFCINVEMPTQWRCECKEGYRHEDIAWDPRTGPSTARMHRRGILRKDEMGQVMIYFCMVQIALTSMNVILVIIIVMSFMANA